MCLVCLDKIGDEFHFLLECPRHQSLRSRLIGRYYWNRPSMLKLQQLFNSTCTNVIRAVAKFVYKAFNDLWFYVIHVCRFCTFWYPVAILCNCVRHADQMFLSRMTFVRARGPKTIMKSLNPWILESMYAIGLFMYTFSHEMLPGLLANMLIHVDKIHIFDTKKKICEQNIFLPLFTQWRHQKETFSALLAHCEGNSPVTGEFPSQRPVSDAQLWWFFTCVWTKGCANNRDAGDLRRHRAHYDVTLMIQLSVG